MNWEALDRQLQLLPDYLSGHMLLTCIALAAGIVVSIPLSLLIVRRERLRGPVLTVASVIQTVPSLALLALMVPLLGGTIGRVPAIIALFLYSVLPIVRNTVTGVLNVDAAVVEAARGIGMTEGQMLRKVQFPLALPVIIAGIRTATVWVVGIATLSTPVGATSLGNYIFSGLQTRTWMAVYVGCAAAAALAIVLDQLIRLVEVSIQRGSARLGVAAAAGLVGVFGGGLWPLAADWFRNDPRPAVVVGAKTFTEQYILARVIADALRSEGYRARPLESLGSTVVFEALVSGEIDVYVDYSGTIWANHMRRDDNPGRDEVLTEMTRWLDETHGVLAMGSIGFENAYAVAMPERRAEELGIRTIADLARHAEQMTVGGDYEFFARPEWDRVRQDYGVSFRDIRSLDSTLMYGAARDGQVDAIIAFSTDGRIAAYELRVLGDPAGSLPPYDAVVLVSPRAREDAHILRALRGLIGAIDDRAMRHANMIVDVEERSVEEAAAFLMDLLRAGS